MTLKILKLLLDNKKITQQQYKTYRGQVIHGDEIPCIIGLMRNRLISKEKGEKLIEHIKLGYTE